MNDIPPKAEDLEDNKADFVEGQPNPHTVEHNLSSKTEQPGGTSRLTEYSPIQKITVTKREADAFRTQRTRDEAYDRFMDTRDPKRVTISRLSYSDPDSIAEYVHDHGADLSPEAKFFLEVSAESQRLRTNTHPGNDQEEVELKDEEAKNYRGFRAAAEFSEALGKYLALDEKNESDTVNHELIKVIDITTQSDPAKVAEFMTTNWENLSPAALDVLNASLKSKVYRAA